MRSLRQHYNYQLYLARASQVGLSRLTFKEFAACARELRPTSSHFDFNNIKGSYHNG